MEGRKPLLVVLGLLAAMAGCNTPSATKPQETSRISLGLPSSPPPDKAKDQPDKPLGAASFVAMASFHMKEGQGQADIPLLQQEQYNKARKAYQKAIQLDPRYTPAHEGLASLYLLMDDYDHAIASYQKALQVAPDNAALWYQLGMCHCRRKDFDRGVPCLSKASDLDPENRQYANGLGYTLARMGRYDQSLACFCRVQSKAKAHYNLARMLLHTGQTELGKQHLRRALQEDPNLALAQGLLVEVTTGVPRTVQPVSYQESDAPEEPQSPIPIGPYAHRIPAIPKPASSTPPAPVPAEMPNIVSAPMSARPTPPAPRPTTPPQPPEPAVLGVYDVPPGAMTERTIPSSGVLSPDTGLLQEPQTLPAPPAPPAPPGSRATPIMKPWPKFDQP